MTTMQRNLAGVFDGCVVIAAACGAQPLFEWSILSVVPALAAILIAAKRMHMEHDRGRAGQGRTTIVERHEDATCPQCRAKNKENGHGKEDGES